MDTLIQLRALKHMGVAIFTSGVIGAIALGDPELRRRSVQHLATAGLVVTWTAGYALLGQLGLTLREPWVALSVLTSLMALGAATWSAGEAEVPPLAGALAVGGLVATFGTMSARAATPLLTAAAPTVAAMATAILLRRAAPHGLPGPTQRAATFEWFAWIARAEGVSLLLLFGLYMPLKHAAGIVLDGGRGWFGWVHGMMQLLFLVALFAVSRAHGWSWRRRIVAFAASLVPLGTFLFEARLRRDAN